MAFKLGEQQSKLDVGLDIGQFETILREENEVIVGVGGMCTRIIHLILSQQCPG